jgi:hypothetical protein
MTDRQREASRLLPAVRIRRRSLLALAAGRRRRYHTTEGQLVTTRLRPRVGRLIAAITTVGVFGTILLGLAAPASAASVLGSGQRLNPGGAIAAGSYRLIMQTDGNLVMYNSAGTALWHSHTAGQRGNYVVMQADGNLVVYNGSSWRWQSATEGYAGSRLAIQTDGNLVIYSGTRPLWAKSWVHTASGAKAYAQVRFRKYGWAVGSQFPPLDNLWIRESNWRWNADNPTSSAYGIPQALPGSKMAVNGPDWASNGLTQVAWGLAYIRSRYGTPQGAWNFWQANGWY